MPSLDCIIEVSKVVGLFVLVITLLTGYTAGVVRYFEFKYGLANYILTWVLIVVPILVLLILGIAFSLHQEGRC